MEREEGRYKERDRVGGRRKRLEERSGVAERREELRKKRIEKIGKGEKIIQWNYEKRSEKMVTDRIRTPIVALRKPAISTRRSTCKQTPRAVATLPARGRAQQHISSITFSFLGLSSSSLMPSRDTGARKVRGSCNLRGARLVTLTELPSPPSSGYRETEGKRCRKCLTLSDLLIRDFVTTSL